MTLREASDKEIAIFCRKYHNCNGCPLIKDEGYCLMDVPKRFLNKRALDIELETTHLLTEEDLAFLKKTFDVDNIQFLIKKPTSSPDIYMIEVWDFNSEPRKSHCLIPAKTLFTNLVLSYRYCAAELAILNLA